MAHEMFNLTGRVALVTGAASGMGRAMSLALAGAGARVLMVDINAAGVEQTAADAVAAGGLAVGTVCDMTNIAAVDGLFARIDREYGQIDFLGNVAGEAVRGRPEEISLADVQTTIHNLVISRFYCTQQAGKRMLKQGRGSIVSIGSLASVTAMGRGHIAYSMGMGAVVQMTRELSTEWAARGVRVNAILPAQVVNAGLEKRMAEDPTLKDRFLSGIPAGRLGKPDDIRGLAVFLASDASAWITGSLFPMDGGNLACNAGATMGEHWML
ncbi:MAG: SDR family oxidoreductase [Planctomycetota bacterium]|nr:SDR family oxidoreductase [Planctomycetota bacterium]